MLYLAFNGCLFATRLGKDPWEAVKGLVRFSCTYASLFLPQRLWRRKCAGTSGLCIVRNFYGRAPGFVRVKCGIALGDGPLASLLLLQSTQEFPTTDRSVPEAINLSPRNPKPIDRNVKNKWDAAGKWFLARRPRTKCRLARRLEKTPSRAETGFGGLLLLV